MLSSWVARRSSGSHDVAAARGALRADGETRVAAYGACKRGVAAVGFLAVPAGPLEFPRGPHGSLGPFCFLWPPGPVWDTPAHVAVSPIG